MAKDLQLNYASAVSVTISGLSLLADGGIATSVVYDLGQPGPFGLALDMTLQGASTLASGTVDIYAGFSNASTKMPDDNNDLLVDSVKMNGTTQVVSHVFIDVDGRFARVRADNNANFALSSAGVNFFEFQPVAGDQA